MIRQITSYILILLGSLKEWRVFVGRRPLTVPPRSIIIFPVTPHILMCGLAGIVTIRRDESIADRDIVDHLALCGEQIQTRGMKKICNQPIHINEYLGGMKKLRGMEKLVLELKRDITFEHVFFTDGEIPRLSALSNKMKTLLKNEEELIEKKAVNFSSADMEHINNSLTLFRDLLWALEKDVLANVEKILYLAAAERNAAISRESFRKFRKINLLLNSIDRLEVRGRDSAGIQITFVLEDTYGLTMLLGDLAENDLYDEWLKRIKPGDLYDGSIQLSEMTGRVNITFTFKKASVTGKLGENVRYLGERIRSDRILQTIVRKSSNSDMYLAHTRWASVGSITEENCHPVNNFTLNTKTERSSEGLLPFKVYPLYGEGNWSINVALNGDIDNYNSLRAAIETEGSTLINNSVTTDTKIIPLQIEKYLSSGHTLQESFRLVLNDFEGSHAIAMQSNLEPDKMYLALRGSGQSMYVGLSDDQIMFSSELYGLVEVTHRFIKMDGETERIPGDPSTKGQIFILERNGKRPLQGISAFYYDGFPLTINGEMIQEAEITTRDIDRKDYPHYLLKEIFEAPLSARKTLRGKYNIRYGQDGGVSVDFNLGNDIVPQKLNDIMKSGTIRNIFVIGQGTAAVAGSAIAEALSKYLTGLNIRIEAMTATELSGFFLEDNVDNTLIIAVTQSGTTTDTNRAVAMAKERGIHLISIVNRRQSDITHVTDGVFYTSDGRDIEMSVASTKAFYSQIVAGYILALYFAKVLGTMTDDRIADELAGLENAPEKMNAVIATKEKIRESAWEIVKKKKYWAVVGSGPNKVAADEIRIKLSELCYKTISSDVVEDKKHIDLSSEPLILVCAAGYPEPVIDDIVKDVAIFKAHAAATVVITDEGEKRFDDVAGSVIYVPRSPFPASVILNTLAGHIWGYYAACSINDDGEFFRSFRNRLSLTVREIDKKKETLFEKIADSRLRKIIEEFWSAFRERKDKGFFSSLTVELASDIPLLLKYAAGKLPLEEFWEEFKEKRISSSPLDMLDITLGRVIDELSRPIDAIRHQAKTVTVGTSRKGDMLRGILFEFLRDLEFSLENLTSKEGAAAKRLQQAISGIRGYTLYDIEKLDIDGKPGEFTTISIRDRGGISLAMKSRAEKPRPLSGTKKTIISTGDIYAGLGKYDKAPIIIMPLLGKGHVISYILLGHVEFRQNLTPSEKKDVLGDKFNKINNLMDEYNIPWDDGYLENITIEFLLGEGVDVIVGKMIQLLEGKSLN